MTDNPAHALFKGIIDAHFAIAGTVDPRAPDPSREGIFRNHNCAGCGDGARPCREGASNLCSWPRARND
jgi:hypothetical protein